MRSEGWERRWRRHIEDELSRRVYTGIWNPIVPWEVVIRDSARDHCY